ncbi:hypothetical protein ILUMI_06793 [Ignelater luminosus]|uniref:Uncharacterized protein n=1 Tax=Ignelater luminosus TaxID=2038154 RepID=A0A8K0GIP7_IGNLU|nr:hypothetical protein ILUMI_06793 [Ignelater luminosus]
MFERPAKIDLKSWGIPQDKIANINSKESVATLIQGFGENTDNIADEMEPENDKETLESKFGKKAKKIMKFCNETFSEVNIGTTVRVPIPDVDRARDTSRNILA